MRIMFTGTHGIGKSQTAIKLSKLLPDSIYIPSFAGPVAERMGFDLNRPHTNKQVIEYQERLLEVYIESFKATKAVNTIYDRSPNDLAAYMYAGLGNDPEYAVKVQGFVQRCLNATREYCDVLVYPNADLSEPMENKFNRPTGEKYSRIEFDKIIDVFATSVSLSVRVIDIPIEHQYDARINYILQRLN